ncbi:Smr/MutS family protein [Sphingomonas sp. CL5.1]|uniref:Smr/MutS family protein n=1 Tax=Sphingomonas sp. CL5.1 TaxID=2653203 RepID=UPI001581B8F0|nr:Smr/MutS family protein [Sphingomonas sp. CL5.1]QKR99972.1 Smr/MutS family protein [Sphingomonas sp. CL5.1]
MAGRRLDAEEAALWARVKASVRPLHPRPPRAVAKAPPEPEPAPPLPGKRRVATPLPRPATSPRVAATPAAPAPATLDGSWDRRITRGTVQPDATLDLHGHNLRSAHALLDAGLERSIARGDRVLLLVTGKPPRPGSERPHARGAIRAAVADWIAASRHAPHIAALRNAHPRHGGNGAIYVVFRRSRPKH